ncbi:MAG: hypothetical protein ACPGVN_01045 [Alphaproteobacteria bacterium]
MPTPPSSILSKLPIGPKLTSVLLHVSVVGLLSLYSIGDDDVPALPTVQAIDLVIETGLIEDVVEEPDDVESEDTQDVLPEAAAKPLETVQDITLPDDLKLSNERETAQPLGQPLIVDNQVKPALTPEAAQDLLIAQNDQQSASFNPDGKATEDEKSAAQQRADAGSDSQEQENPQEVETPSNASVDQAVSDLVDRILSSSTGEDGVEQQDPTETDPTDAENTDAATTDAGKQVVEDDPKPSTAEQGEDKINLADASTDLDAEKVTTPIPKPKPRALAKAFKKEQERQQAAAEKLRKEQEEAKRVAEKLEAEKLEQAKKDKEALEKLMAAAKPDNKPDVQPEEVKPDESKPDQPSEAELTDQLNDQMLALLNEDATTTEQVKLQQAGASALSSLNIEVDRISNRIGGSWYIPPGLDISTVPSVSLVLDLNEDATINTITANNQERYSNDAVYRQVADSAMRALMSDGPLFELKDIPYELWKTQTISFATSDFVRN